MNKRQRPISTVDDCDIIEISQNKIRKLMPVPTDEIIDIIDLTSGESDDSENFIDTTKMTAFKSKQNFTSINNTVKVEKDVYPLDVTDCDNVVSKSNDKHSEYNEDIDLNNTALISELCSEFTDDICDKNNLQNLSSKKLISQDSAVVAGYFELNPSDIQFSGGIDDLLSENSDSDDNNKSNSDSLKNNSSFSKSSSLSRQHSKTLPNLLSTNSQSTKEQFISQSSVGLTTADSGLNTSDIHFLDDIDDLLSDDWNDDCDDGNKMDHSLDLSNYRRCKITKINRKLRYIELIVSDTELSNTAVVLCTENWRDMTLETGEFVIIKAKYCEFENKWVINNEYGMCVTQPDTLVSGTAVVQGLFCNRRGILQHIYTGIECLPNMEANDAALTCGSITHELLQTALKDKIYDLDGIRKLLERILKLPSTIIMLYMSNLTVKQFKEMISEYIPKIYEFISRYIEGNKPEQLDDNFAGKIECVRDIEESVWLPTLGLKGKIDATVEVTIHERRGIMPLEIKSGRSSFSSEHKGQVYLYIMMMQMLGHDLSSGLLLYIKENIMHEIKSTRHEERDLLLLRNMMAYYLSREPTIADESNNLATIKCNKWKLPELPEPIYNNSACKRCSFNTICCVYAKDDKNLLLPDNHPHSRLQKTLLQDLTSDHIDYVINWASLLQMESSFQKSVTTDYAIWSRSPTQREDRRTCLSYVTIELPIVKKNNMFLHKFVRDPKEKLRHAFPIDDFRKVFVSDDYAMISTDIRINIVNGCIVTVTKDSISVLINKDMSQWNAMSYYHIDELQSISLPYKALGTIAAMLSDNDITRRLRRIIIDKEPATFTNKLPEKLMLGTGEKIMNQLNYYQQEALKAVITSTDFVLIKGMPGTGKTQTLVALIQMLSYLGHSVLITAHTHMAIDNILQKLNEKDIDFLRLGSKNRVHASLRHKTFEYLLNECQTPEQLDAAYKKKNIVAVTCLGANHALLSKRIFDYCLVDECTQAMQPVLLRPLYNAIKFVLVGDPEQLPAVVKSNEARKLGMDEDLFTRLDTINNTRMLKQQYRMNKPIMDLANKLTYKGELLVGSEEVANATLKLPNPKVLESCEEWVKRALACDLKNAVVMLNTRITHNMHLTLYTQNKILDRDDQSSRFSNYVEAAIILRLLNMLMMAGMKCEDIGVIAPYQAQLKLLKRVIMVNVDINTVDQFQGRDKHVILLSCTRTGESDFRKRNNDEYEILSDHKRLNVALTRAKHKLIIIGDKSSLLRFTPFEKLFSILDDEIVDLYEERNQFSWPHLMRLIEDNETKAKSQ